MNWNYVFSNKTADEIVKSLNNILLNMFRNFVPNKVIKVGYKYPNWMNPKIISFLRDRSELTKRYYSNPTEENKNLTDKSNEYSNMIVEAKDRYTNKLSKKLDDPSTMPQAYWSVLNTFLNNKKIPNIPPLNVNVLKYLNPEKTHGWDNISIRMIQLCGKAIVENLFLSFLDEGVYPDDCKKSIVVLFHKKRK